jgi:hypothetical protein
LSEYILMIGAYGWEHPRWTEEFYPEGLPPEWQLGFYGNEFPVVLIPATYWTRTDLSVDEWLEETDNSPQFLSEWPDEPVARERARAGMQRLGARGLGFVIEPGQRPGSADLTIYKELITRHALVFDMAHLSVAEKEATLSALTEALGANRFGLCWHGDPETQANLALGPMTLTRISSVQDHKDLRRIIEANLGQSEQNRKKVLIVDGDPPDIQLIQNAGIMLDLL